jgi:hypothetical protein
VSQKAKASGKRIGTSPTRDSARHSLPDPSPALPRAPNSAHDVLRRRRPPLRRRAPRPGARAGGRGLTPSSAKGASSGACGGAPRPAGLSFGRLVSRASIECGAGGARRRAADADPLIRQTHVALEAILASNSCTGDAQVVNEAVAHFGVDGIVAGVGKAGERGVAAVVRGGRVGAAPAAPHPVRTPARRGRLVRPRGLGWRGVASPGAAAKKRGDSLAAFPPPRPSQSSPNSASRTRPGLRSTTPPRARAPCSRAALRRSRSPTPRDA